MKYTSTGDRIMMVFIYLLLILLGFSTFYPFWNGLVISLNNGMDTALGGITFWPRVWSLENYRVVFQDDRIANAFLISVLRTVVGTILSVLCTAIFAYGMTKKELIGRKFYMLMCVVTMYFGGGLIPTFLVVRGLGLMNSFWVFIIPGLISVWNMIIFRTFFMGLPGGLEESAKIDGCGNWATFFRIILPLSGPVIATLGLFTAVAHWNEWFLPSIYITNEKLLPIQSMLQQILSTNIMTEQMSKLDSAAQSRLETMKSVTTKSLSMATMMVATLPIIAVYPFVQKYFVKGVMVGSLKE
ncbi:carbohydrate ABC transporter membrane protein 2 (CUT1 family) [Paenibacillus sp. VMFN-D1]|uniref:Aldouronate transport system permease protein n=2 Tax=Paenibacillus TaxID=44249 RepID=A0ABV2F355_9BACL|nr:carbohydrate ABC transporter membrane protein 2 (CUT1 family) [Paenibacillus sp. VMFN-D1]GIO61053.1 sugar ABC transporter permease [Paenibacillus cineris]